MRSTPTPHSVCIARHGIRLDFADPEWFKTAARPYDPPLAPAGVMQARELAQRLHTERIAHIFSSPFLRCVETASEIASLLELPIEIEPGLSEWLNAAWFDALPPLLPLATLRQRFPRIDASYTGRGKATFAESGEDALRRSGDTALRLIADFPGNLLLIGHGASVLGATAALLHTPLKQAGRLLPPIRCCALVKLTERAPDQWVLELAGDVAHLSHTETDVRYG